MPSEEYSEDMAVQIVSRHKQAGTDIYKILNSCKTKYTQTFHIVINKNRWQRRVQDEELE